MALLVFRSNADSHSPCRAFWRLNHPAIAVPRLNNRVRSAPWPRGSMAAMGWRTTGDVAEFLAAAGAYLRRERARNTVILTVTEQCG